MVFSTQASAALEHPMRDPEESTTVKNIPLTDVLESEPSTFIVSEIPVTQNPFRRKKGAVTSESFCRNKQEKIKRY